MAGIHIGPSRVLRTNPRRRSRSAWLRRTLLAAGRHVVIVLGQATVFLALLAVVAFVWLSLAYGTTAVVRSLAVLLGVR